MKTLSVMGQTYALAPPKREKLPNVLVSHLKGELQLLHL